MKNILFLFISLFIISCSKKQHIETEYLYQVNSDVNLRQKPSAKSKIIDVLKQNETVQLADSLNGWYNVIDDGLKSGYVSKENIDRITKEKIVIKSFLNKKVIFLLGFTFLFNFWLFKRRSKIKKEQKILRKEKAKRDAKRKRRLAALETKKQEEDEKLAAKKNVTCDDGVVRKYNSSMYGIIKEQVKDILVSSISPDKMKGYSLLFEKEIKNYNWFSEDGITLKSKQVLAKQKKYFSLKRNYEERYRELLVQLRFQPGGIVGISSLCCINNTFFHAHASSKLPHKLFSGIIDGSRYVNGVLEVKSDVKQDKNQLDTSNEVVIAKNILFPGLPKKIVQEIEKYHLSMDEKIKSFDRDEDLGYWFKINIDSVDNPISVNARKMKGYSKEKEMSEFLWGHDEEYELKMQGYPVEEKEKFISMRIISFGGLLGFYDEIIEKLNSLSKRENIDLNKRIDRLELELVHCKARLYGSIKFALRNKISKKLIKDWYYDFEDNNQLYVGSNPMDNV